MSEIDPATCRKYVNITNKDGTIVKKWSNDQDPNCVAHNISSKFKKHQQKLEKMYGPPGHSKNNPFYVHTVNRGIKTTTAMWDIIRPIITFMLVIVLAIIALYFVYKILKDNNPRFFEFLNMVGTVLHAIFKALFDGIDWIKDFGGKMTGWFKDIFSSLSPI